MSPAAALVSEVTVTRREEFARIFMTELIRKADPENIAPPEQLADFAVRLSDALLERLKK